MAFGIGEARSAKLRRVRLKYGETRADGNVYWAPWWEHPDEKSEPLPEWVEAVYEEAVIVADEQGNEQLAQTIVQSAEGADGALLPEAERQALIAHLAKQNPKAVHALIGGQTIPRILASVEEAKAEYKRIEDAVNQRQPVAAGGAVGPGAARAGAPALDVSKMSPLAKIALGMGERTRSK